MFQKNISLRSLNTFGIAATAKQFLEVTSLETLEEIVSSHKDLFILSGGSNILLTQDIDKPVIYLNTKGIEIIDKNRDSVWIKAQAGENWHEFVCWCLEKNFGGLENLSLIPGNVGTSPMQNIGAYGVEIKDCFESLEAMEISSGEIRKFTTDDCAFGYREYDELWLFYVESTRCLRHIRNQPARWAPGGDIRAIFDGTNGVYLNLGIRIRDRVRFPTACDIKAVLAELAEEGGVRWSLLFDVGKAHRRIPVLEEE